MSSSMDTNFVNEEDIIYEEDLNAELNKAGPEDDTEEIYFVTKQTTVKTIIHSFIHLQAKKEFQYPIIVEAKSAADYIAGFTGDLLFKYVLVYLKPSLTNNGDTPLKHRIDELKGKGEIPIEPHHLGIILELKTGCFPKMAKETRTKRTYRRSSKSRY
ncbi:hypothetical protein C1645_825698 [Glomus cerebriforme]|uniref:DUF7276 domain-containing protein n=1 Tax=Glomus cerebriforme TaxID=658196 RepID=A0A397T1D9_9GLOM|nr:hypothetical protein C1645_825698 [Glomus cerebriforme]